MKENKKEKKGILGFLNRRKGKSSKAKNTFEESVLDGKTSNAKNDIEDSLIGMEIDPEKMKNFEHNFPENTTNSEEIESHKDQKIDNTNNLNDTLEKLGLIDDNLNQIGKAINEDKEDNSIENLDPLIPQNIEFNKDKENNISNHKTDFLEADELRHMGIEVTRDEEGNFLKQELGSPIPKNIEFNKGQKDDNFNHPTDLLEADELKEMGIKITKKEDGYITEKHDPLIFKSIEFNKDQEIDISQNSNDFLTPEELKHMDLPVNEGKKKRGNTKLKGREKTLQDKNNNKGLKGGRVTL